MQHVGKLSSVSMGAVQAQREVATGVGQICRTRPAYLRAKRCLDIVLALLALVLLSPLMFLIALLIRLDSPGPALFRQERMGYDWRTGREGTFIMLKFRSMLYGCDQRVHEELVRNWVRGIASGKQTGELVKLSRDPRVTRIGNFLRKTSLDELPQLLNVVQGSMSLVGPRPVPLYEVAEYASAVRKRLEATPGITGLWQVKGRGLSSVEEMAYLDIQYIERQSLWFDLEILLLTVPAVLSGRGAA